MHPYEYNIHLRLSHPNQDLGEIFVEISKISGFKPGRIWKAGDSRETLKGTKLDGVYSSSYCYFDFFETLQKSDQVSLLEEIEKIIEKITPLKSNLLTFIQNGGRLELVIALYVDSNSAEVFSPALMKKIADLEIELWFDIYPPEDLKDKG